MIPYPTCWTYAALALVLAAPLAAPVAAQQEDALAACLAPAIRAMRTNPIQALRYE